MAALTTRNDGSEQNLSELKVENPGMQSRQPPSAGDRWRTIVDALPDAALTLDAEGRVSHHNKLLTSLFPKMRVGEPMGQLLRNPDLMAAIYKAAGESGPTIVVRFSERVPVARRIEANVTRLEPALDTALLLVTFRDLTEHERIEQMRADFVANASHELRTPLAALQGYIETLQGAAKNDENVRERFLGIMLAQAKRMTRLVDDLLSLSRVEMRVHLPPQGRCDANEIATEVVQSLSELASRQNSKIILNKLHDPAFIRADREEIIQSLQNLVHNALKYGKESGTVRVLVDRSKSGDVGGNKLIISVIDEGQGIEAHHLPRLVERFYRINPASSREKGGTGLGLAIVKHIMARHNGELLISSTVGVGSTFALSFDELVN